MDVILVDEDFTVTAKALVRAEIVNAWEDLFKDDPETAGDGPEEFETKIVWACKTLQNWKAWVISTLHDNLMYEVTYNGDKKEAYIDTYDKFKQTVVRDGD